MNCPIDGTTLQMTDRQGIEIDYCPQCRGVWLDRGELDKLIERATVTAAPMGAVPPAPAGHYPTPNLRPGDRPSRRDDDDWDDDERRGYGGYGEGQGRKKRKKSFLDDIFDF